MLGCCGGGSQGVGRVFQMSVGILLYTRVVGRVYYRVVADYSGIKNNTRVVGGVLWVLACDVCWRGEVLRWVAAGWWSFGCGGVLCTILSGAKDLGDTSSLLTSNRGWYGAVFARGGV